MVADEYAHHGWTTVVQDIALGDDLRRYVDRVRTRPLYVVVLAPSAAAVRSREAGRQRALREETPRIGLRLDTSDQTPDRTAAAILDNMPAARVDADRALPGRTGPPSRRLTGHSPVPVPARSPAGPRPRDRLLGVEAIVASAIAVLGTLLGSGLTLRYQQRATDRTHALTVAENLRRERLDAYASCAGAFLDYRRSLIHLWCCRYDEEPPEDAEVARPLTYPLRKAAQEATFRLQMLSDDESLGNAARDLLDEIAQLHHSTDRDELNARRTSTRNGIYALVAAGKKRL